MEIRLVSRHERASPSLQESITTDLQKLERFSEKITSCHVILDTEKLFHTAEITMHVFDREVVALGKAENIGKAFYIALEKIERQLIKINQKIKGHKHA
ncbi:MAG: ribosome-associated translation inhibitor RaiA [Chitinispirillaceae bacterium]|nr:ribosome-associated translation inhibitor RaiA [Chitinispirillaceae bacterium]